MNSSQYLVKICGLTNLKDAIDANNAGADFLGMVLHPASKRHTTLEKSLKIMTSLPNKNYVIVFGYDSYEFIINTYQNLKTPNLKVQLPYKHENFLKIADEIKFENIIPSISVINENSIETFKNLEDFSFVIFDSAGIKLENGFIIPGGSGKTFNWNLLKSVQIPFFLAGGITLENVSSALEKVNPTGIDVAGGTEMSYGIKDTNKMIEFIKLIKSKPRIQ
ncbi:MAG: phosphoribosylanthranilate isomerase [Spirochaetia bacterium]|nr:phosphoribosylanthranilate isomerase [Spirochaetia bacterium]